MGGANCKLLSVTFGVLALLLHSAEGQGVRPINGNDNGRCEAFAQASIFCANVGYNMVFLPNARGHDTQAAAEAEVDDFTQLVSSGCSDALYIFLCSYYFPLCFINHVSSQPIKIKTCRSLCEFVRPPCEPWLNARNFSWPSFFNCSLDDFSDDRTCFGPAELRNLSIPGTVPNIEVTLTTGEEIPMTMIEPSATATFALITPTPPSQSTTGGVLEGTDVTTTRSSGVHTAQRVDQKTSVVALITMLIYLQW